MRSRSAGYALDPALLSDAVPRLFPGAQAFCRASLPSTMDEARALLLRGYPSGTTVFAEVQTRGRGRSGRRWFSSPGLDLTFSCVLEEPRDSPGFLPATVIGALAVRNALKEMSVDTTIRWPNDIVTPRGKLAGVLAESPSDVRGCVVGIGINVNSTTQDMPESLRGDATSLYVELGRQIPLTNVALCVLSELHTLHRDFETFGHAALEVAWRAASATLGRRARITAGGVAYEGLVTCLSVKDGLTLQLPRGYPKVFRADTVESCVHLY